MYRFMSEFATNKINFVYFITDINDVMMQSSIYGRMMSLPTGSTTMTSDGTAGGGPNHRFQHLNYGTASSTLNPYGNYTIPTLF